SAWIHRADDYAEWIPLQHYVRVVASPYRPVLRNLALGVVEQGLDILAVGGRAGLGEILVDAHLLRAPALTEFPAVDRRVHEFPQPRVKRADVIELEIDLH